MPSCRDAHTVSPPARPGAGGCRRSEEVGQRLLGGHDEAVGDPARPVEHFRGVSDLPPPVTGYRIRPYLVRTAAHLRIAGGARYSRTFHGTIGNQDAYFCAQ